MCNCRCHCQTSGPVPECQTSYTVVTACMLLWGCGREPQRTHCCTVPELCVTDLALLPPSNSCNPFTSFKPYKFDKMTYFKHPCQLTTHSKAACRARPFPRHTPSSAVAARTLRHSPRGRGTIRHAQQAQEPVLPENIDLNDPELQAQISALLKELDPDLLLVSAKQSVWQC
jgi:hypothetical protein